MNAIIEPRLGSIEPLMGRVEDHLGIIKALLGKIELCFGTVKPVKGLKKLYFENVSRRARKSAVVKLRMPEYPDEQGFQDREEK